MLDDLKNYRAPDSFQLFDEAEVGYILLFLLGLALLGEKLGIL